LLYSVVISEVLLDFKGYLIQGFGQTFEVTVQNLMFSRVECLSESFGLGFNRRFGYYYRRWNTRKGGT